MREDAMTDVKPAPKKSVALSGVVAGNTALCSVGRSGNDLHYRGYDILDVAGVCEFEEIAHLLVHGSLPTRSRTRQLQGQAEIAARPAARGAEHARTIAGGGASDGRDALRRLGARLRAAGEPRPQSARRARHRRPPDGLARLDAALLAPLRA